MSNAVDMEIPCQTLLKTQTPLGPEIRHMFSPGDPAVSTSYYISPKGTRCNSKTPIIKGFPSTSRSRSAPSVQQAQGPARPLTLVLGAGKTRRRRRPRRCRRRRKPMSLSFGELKLGTRHHAETK